MTPNIVQIHKIEMSLVIDSDTSRCHRSKTKYMLFVSCTNNPRTVSHRIANETQSSPVLTRLIEKQLSSKGDRYEVQHVDGWFYFTGAIL